MQHSHDIAVNTKSHLNINFFFDESTSKNNSSAIRASFIVSVFSKWTAFKLYTLSAGWRRFISALEGLCYVTEKISNHVIRLISPLDRQNGAFHICLKWDSDLRYRFLFCSFTIKWPSIYHTTTNFTRKTFSRVAFYLKNIEIVLTI